MYLFLVYQFWFSYVFSKQPHHITYFCPWRENKKQPWRNIAQTVSYGARSISWKWKIHKSCRHGYIHFNTWIRPSSFKNNCCATSTLEGHFRHVMVCCRIRTPVKPRPDEYTNVTCYVSLSYSILLILKWCILGRKRVQNFAQNLPAIH